MNTYQGIAICGKMGAGKSYFAKELKKYLSSKDTNNKDFFITSISSGVYKIAKDYFGMNPQNKDRKLLQEIGTKMREINDKVWFNYLMSNLKDHLSETNSFMIVDDCRLENDFHYFKNNNFYMIKLDIDNELQEKRIKSTYLEQDWNNHLLNRNHVSEKEIDNIPYNLFDQIIDSNNLEDPDYFNYICNIIYYDITHYFIK